MDDAIRIAIARRAQLAEEMALVDQYIALHAKLFGETKGSEIENVSKTDGNDDGLADTSGAVTVKRRNNPKAVADRVEAILRQEGRPIQRGELIKRVEDSGMPIHSVDKGKYIGTILWRESDRFVNVEGAGYWLAGVSWRTPEQIQNALMLGVLA